MISGNPVAPPFLTKNDKVAFTAPASRISRDTISNALEIISGKWGLEVVIGDTIGSAEYDFSAPDSVRKTELQSYLDDPDIKAIFSARGGYGCSRIIDQLDFRKFVGSPKWIIGFSDITALHLEIQSLGFQSIHGPMPKTMKKDEVSDETLHTALFGGTLEYNLLPDPMNLKGECTGQAVGGNLCLIAHSIGSASDRTFDGKILFLEDIAEYLYNIDRMMVQLSRAKKLRNLAGVVVGDFSDSRENDEPFGKNAQEIILDYVGSLGIPVAFGFPFGHEHRNYSIRMGECMHLSVNETGSRLTSSPGSSLP